MSVLEFFGIVFLVLIACAVGLLIWAWWDTRNQ